MLIYETKYNNKCNTQSIPHSTLLLTAISKLSCLQFYVSFEFKFKKNLYGPLYKISSSTKHLSSICMIERYTLDTLLCTYNILVSVTLCTADRKLFRAAGQ